MNPPQAPEFLVAETLHADGKTIHPCGTKGFEFLAFCRTGIRFHRDLAVFGQSKAAADAG